MDSMPDPGHDLEPTPAAGRAGRSAARSSRIGLCLSGGGLTGAMYQVGCLAALEDGVEGFGAGDFDVYVGTASGATVAMAMAAGLSVQRIYRAMLNPADDFFPLHRNHLLRIDMGEMGRVFGSAILAARRVVSSATANPRDLRVWDELERFVDSLPAGIFTLDAYERFVRGFMRRRRIPDRFSQLSRMLRVVATDLDRGERVVLGGGELADVPVSSAVTASTAIPILYAPVRIDGRDYVDGGLGDVAHVDVAVDLGCDTVVVINPMVPVHTDPHARDVPTGHGRMLGVRDKGMVWVYNQAMRTRMEGRFRVGMQRYLAEHPGLDLVLLEPEQARTTLFMYSPMNFAARRKLLEEGYTSTMLRLKDEGSPLTRSLRACGLRVAT